jgi:hypothetical protein
MAYWAYDEDTDADTDSIPGALGTPPGQMPEDEPVKFEFSDWMQPKELSSNECSCPADWYVHPIHDDPVARLSSPPKFPKPAEPEVGVWQNASDWLIAYDERRKRPASLDMERLLDAPRSERPYWYHGSGGSRIF